MDHSGCHPKPSRLPIHIPTIERMRCEKGAYSGFMLHTPLFNAWGVSHASTKITVAWVAESKPLGRGFLLCCEPAGQRMGRFQVGLATATKGTVQTNGTISFPPPL